MRRIIGWVCMAITVSMVLVGCESDSTPDQIVFRNDSSHEVRVTLDKPEIPFHLTFTLAPNGGEQEQLKMFAEDYTYTPTATVSDRRQGHKVFFEDRAQNTRQ